MASSTVDFQLFDADNHYYEATDAFTRHLEPQLAEAHDAVGGDQREAAAARRRPGQPLHPEPDLRSRRAARRARRLLPRPEGGRRHPRRVRRARADQPGVPRAGGPRRADGRAGDRRVLPLPDARRRDGAAARQRPRGGPRRVPRVQPVDARRLDVRLPGPDLRRAVLHAARPGRRGARARLGARAGREGHRHARRAGAGADRVPLTRRPRVRPVLGPPRRSRDPRRVPLG